MSEFQHLFTLLLKNEQLNQKQQQQFLKWTALIERKPSADRTADEWFALGVKAQLTNDLDEAEFCFSEAIRKDASFEAAYQRRGSVYTEQEDFVRAEADFTKALELDPTFTQALVSRSVLFAETGRYEAALADIDAVLQTDPVHAGAIVTRASVFEYQNQYEKAAEALAPLIARYPKDPELYSKRALYYLFADNHTKALEDLNLSARFGQGSSVSDFNYGLVYGLMADHTKETYQRFEKAFRKSPAILRQYHETANERDWNRLFNKLKSILEFQKAQKSESGKFYRNQLIDLLERMLRDFK
jgi:tetratricopeptide (TPR) repeat protein